MCKLITSIKNPIDSIYFFMYINIIYVYNVHIYNWATYESLIFIFSRVCNIPSIFSIFHYFFHLIPHISFDVSARHTTQQYYNARKLNSFCVTCIFSTWVYHAVLFISSFCSWSIKSFFLIECDKLQVIDIFFFFITYYLSTHNTLSNTKFVIGQLDLFFFSKCTNDFGK